MQHEIRHTPQTPQWVCQLANTTEPLPAASWRIVAWLVVALPAHHARTGYTRMRLGCGRAAEIGRCSPRTAQRALASLAAMGVIDRVDDGSKNGAYTGVPSLGLRRHAGNRQVQSAATPNAPTPPHEPLSAEAEESFKDTITNPPTPPRDPLVVQQEEAQEHDDEVSMDTWLWDDIKSLLEEQLEPEVFECYIAPLSVITVHEKTCVLSAPNDIVQDEALAILKAADCCQSITTRVIVGQARPASIESKSTPCPAPNAGESRPVPQSQPGEPRRPITRALCQKAVRDIKEYYGEMAAKGRRPTESITLLYSWVIYHVTYGKGSENLSFNEHRALSGGLSILRSGMTMPNGFQPELVQRYIDWVEDELQIAEQATYVTSGADLRQECQKVAA